MTRKYLKELIFENYYKQIGFAENDGYYPLKEKICLKYFVNDCR